MLTFNLEMQLHYENVNVVSIFIHCQLNCKCQMVPNRFFRDSGFPLFEAEDFEANSGKILDWKYAHELECPK